MKENENIEKGEGEQPKPKHLRSIGEKLFDWGTYGGIAGVGTFLLTIPVAYAMEYGAGKKYCDKAAKWMEQRALKWLPERSRGAIARGTISTTTLMQGGNIMLVPVIVAEHFKVGIANGLNRLFGDKTDSSSIEEVPKQTLGSLFKGRMVAWGVVFTSLTGASLVAGKAMKAFETRFAEAVCKLFKRPLTVATPKGIVPSKAYNYGKLAALDVFATTAAAILLYTGSHFFARRREEHKHQQSEMKPAAPMTPAAGPKTHRFTESLAEERLAAAELSR